MRTWARLLGIFIAGAMTMAMGIGVATARGGMDQPQEGGMPPLGFAITPMSSYRAIVPCRIVQTLGTTPTFTDGTIRTFYVAGSTGFEAQGGQAGGCGIPTGATAIAVSMQAYGGTQFGYLKSWPAPSPEPHASVLTYQAGVQTSNGVTLALGRQEPSLTVKSHGGATQVVIDVLGYYLDPVRAIVATAGAWSSSNRVTAVTKTAVGEWTIEAAHLTSNCPVQVSTEEPDVIAHAFVGYDQITVSVRRLDGTPVDAWFDVTALC